MDNSSQSDKDGVNPPVTSRGRPTERAEGTGRFVARADTAERRRLSAEMRAQGVPWRKVADRHWGGDQGLAVRQVKQFYAENPSEDGATMRRIIADKANDLEQLVRNVMGATHYVVDRGTVVLGTDGQPLVDHAPIFKGIEVILKINDQLIKITPGLAAPKVAIEIPPELVDAQILQLQEAIAAEAAALSKEEDGS